MTVPVVISPEIQRYAQAVGAELRTAIERVSTSAGSRDLGPEPAMGQVQDASAPAGQSPNGSTPTVTLPDVEERFLPILAALLPAVVSAVPSIIQSVRLA